MLILVYLQKLTSKIFFWTILPLAAAITVDFCRRDEGIRRHGGSTDWSSSTDDSEQVRHGRRHVSLLIRLLLQRHRFNHSSSSFSLLSQVIHLSLSNSFNLVVFDADHPIVLHLASSSSLDFSVSAFLGIWLYWYCILLYYTYNNIAQPHPTFYLHTCHHMRF